MHSLHATVGTWGGRRCVSFTAHRFGRLVKINTESDSFRASKTLNCGERRSHAIRVGGGERCNLWRGGEGGEGGHFVHDGN